MEEADPHIGRAIRLNGKAWTILARASWAEYFYLGSQDDEDVIVRQIGLVKRAIELGAEVDPNGV